MSTRGAIGFRIDGTDKVTYNRHDSKPSWLGKRVVEVCKTIAGRDIADTVRGIRLVDEDSRPTPEEVEKYREFLNTGVGEHSETDWYCLLREAQGRLDLYLNGLDVMIDSHEFLADSLFCEWAYIVNLDEGVLEIYRGFNESVGGEGRYAHLHHDHVHGDYWGVRLVKVVPLDTLALATFDVTELEG